MKSKVISIDLAKRKFQAAVSEEPGKVCEEKRLSRQNLIEWLAQLVPAIVVMEACGSAHALGRLFQKFGHEVRLLPPHLVKPYVRGNKTDRADAKGILEASRNEDIKPVPVKTEHQQSILLLHRMRATWMKTRTRRLNTLRGLLREFGYTIPVGRRHVIPAVREHIADLPELTRDVIESACEEIGRLDDKLKAVDNDIRRASKDCPVASLLMTIPGIGPLISTGLVAQIHDPTRFPTSRHLSSFLGLVPSEYSSGEVRRLGRITKRGDRYLRTLMIHGARSVLFSASRTRNPSNLQLWALKLLDKGKGHHRTTVALANRLTRVVWSVWTKQRPWQAEPPVAAS